MLNWIIGDKIRIPIIVLIDIGTRPDPNNEIFR